MSNREYNQAYYLTNKEKLKDHSSIWYRNHRDMRIRANHNWQRKNKDKMRGYRLKQFYGMTNDEYNRMFVSQNGCCGICGIHQSELKRKLVVDHCHHTDKVRALLCDNCNNGLGKFKDNPDLLIKAAQFISDYRKGKLPILL